MSKLYFDYMATTPVDETVLAAMWPYFADKALSGNAASGHHYGHVANAAVNMAAHQVAACIKAEAQEIVWTSGATESNHLAILGAMEFYQKRGRHVVSVSTEHKAVLAPLNYLKQQGYDVTLLTPPPSGVLEKQQVMDAIRDDTVLVSMMHVNNEIGVVQNLAELATAIKERGPLLHVDAAQSVGKVEVNCRDWPIDLLSMSAHKAYGPKGIGALYVRSKPQVRLRPQFMGAGGGSQAWRAGTLPVPLIVGMGQAFELAQACWQEESARIYKLREHLWQTIEPVGGLTINGDTEARVAHNLSVTVSGVDGEALLFALRDFALSQASACNTKALTPSHVLSSLGLSDQQAHSTLRISLGRMTTSQEVDALAQALLQSVMRLRAIAEFPND